jgi:hypothetical protein
VAAHGLVGSPAAAVQPLEPSKRVALGQRTAFGLHGLAELGIDVEDGDDLASVHDPVGVGASHRATPAIARPPAAGRVA